MNQTIDPYSRFEGYYIPNFKKGIIDFIPFYYSKDVSRRAVEGNSCKYKTKDCRVCGVGLFMLNPQEDFVFSASLLEIRVGVSSKVFSDEEFQNLLIPEVRGHSREFWDKIQKLHDSNEFWDEKGLTPDGEEYHKALHLIYC